MPYNPGLDKIEQVFSDFHPSGNTFLFCPFLIFFFEKA